MPLAAALNDPVAPFMAVTPDRQELDIFRTAIAEQCLLQETSWLEARNGQNESPSPS